MRGEEYCPRTNWGQGISSENKLGARNIVWEQIGARNIVGDGFNKIEFKQVHKVSILSHNNREQPVCNDKIHKINKYPWHFNRGNPRHFNRRNPRPFNRGNNCLQFHGWQTAVRNKLQIFKLGLYSSHYLLTDITIIKRKSKVKKIKNFKILKKYGLSNLYKFRMMAQPIRKLGHTMRDFDWLLN